MEIIEKSVSELIPYTRNSRTHSVDQVSQIVDSINEYGFTNPILIDENDMIIAGHGRLEASKILNLDKVPCIVLKGLTDAQKRAYIIADNKMALNSGWNEELLKLEINDLNDLDFDLKLTGFDANELDKILFGEEEPKRNERERTNDAYNLGMIEDNLEGFWQMPVIRNDNYIPESIIGFNYAKSSKKKDVGIHFYLDDYQFERIWNNPEKYIEVLSQYECIFSPDFSLYLDMPMPMKIWNIYRSRAIGNYYQQYGIKVIPTISWAEEDTFKFCFEGIPKGSIVSISTIGVKRDSEALKIWKNGVDAMIKAIEPSAILVYGGELDYDYGDIEVKYYNNEVTDRMMKSAKAKD